MINRCFKLKRNLIFIGSYQPVTNPNTLLKDKFNSKIIESSKEFNFNRFSKILMMSHIMNTYTIQSLRKLFRLNNEIEIRSIINELPYTNRIQIKHMNSDGDNSIEAEIRNILIKFLSHSRGKSVVITDNKEKLHELYHNFKLLVNSDCSLLLFEDFNSKTSITDKFQNDFNKRVLITTEYEILKSLI